MPCLLRAAAVSVVALVALAACGGSNDDVTASTVTTAASATATIAAPTTTAKPTTTTSRSTSTTAAATTTRPVVTLPVTGLSTALLTPSDLPGGFTAKPGEAGDVDAPTPCGTVKAEKQVPSTEQARVELTSADGQLLIDQAVFRYADEAAATKAMPVGLAGLSCLQGSGTSDNGSPYTFDLQAIELPATLGDDRFAFGGTLNEGSSTLQVIFVALRDGALISTLTFLAVAEADAPDAVPVIQTAADRLAQVN